MLLTTEAAIGSAAGITTSVLWTFTSVFFTEAVKRLGVTLVNAARVAMAVVLLGITHRLLSGRWWPEAAFSQVALLFVSGWVGLALGDQVLFYAFSRIGPRRSVLLMTTAPLFATLFGVLFLGERLALGAWLGIGVTLAGIAWVVLERPTTNAARTTPVHLDGLLCGLLAALCQSTGYLLSKQGIGHGWLPEAQRLAPQAAAMLRMVGAAMLLLPIAAWRIRRRSRGAGALPSAAVRQGALPATGLLGPALIFTTLGAVFGPFLGVWASLEAADRIPLGVAQTLLSLPPVLILPFAHYLHGERIGPRAIGGALLAVAGVAWLFLHPA